MRTYNEYKETTNRSVFNKVRISHESSCGYCPLGRGCNKRSRREYYWKGWRKNRGTGEWEKTGKFPSWKITSKKRKQWMDDDTYYEPINYKFAWFRNERPEDYEIKW